MAIKFHFSALLQPRVGSNPGVRSQKSGVRSQKKKSLFSWLLAPGSWLLGSDFLLFTVSTSFSCSATGCLERGQEPGKC